MSHAVVRGKPTKAQLFLDEVLDDVVISKGMKPSISERKKVTLPQIVYHSLKKRPNDVLLINGSTGKRFCNEMLLKQSVPIARSLITKGLSGKRVLICMRNSEYLMAVYDAVLFSGVVPYIIDPQFSTTFEFRYYLNLIEPCQVFCDEEHYGSIKEALKECTSERPHVMICNNNDAIRQLGDGFSDDLDSFVIANVPPESTVMFLPTSGSTGLPKAAALHHRALVDHLPSIWSYASKIPRPTDIAMVLTTSQWITFTITTVTCAVFQASLLLTPMPTTVEHVLDMLQKYRPTWTFFAPLFAKSLVEAATPDHFSSLETAILLGSHPSPEILAAFQEKLPPTAHLCNNYGTTESQGFTVIPDKDTSVHCNGWVVNIMNYKLIDEDGNEVIGCGTGELCLKGDFLIKSYYKDEKSYKETFIDGWYNTGDEFYRDETDRLSYVRRKKFSFKYNNCHVSPEEVENVVMGVDGVRACLVYCDVRGPAAAVVLRPGAQVQAEDIHQAVNATLSEHKRLHGGIIFVDYLPQTHSGKLNRKECQKLVEELELTNGKIEN